MHAISHLLLHSLVQVITNVYHIHYAWLATEAPGINGFVLDLGVPILPCRIVGVHVIFTPLNGVLHRCMRAAYLVQQGCPHGEFWEAVLAHLDVPSRACT